MAHLGSLNMDSGDHISANKNLSIFHRLNPIVIEACFSTHLFASTRCSSQCQVGIVQLFEALNQRQQSIFNFSFISTVQNNDKCIRMNEHLGDQVFHLFRIIAWSGFLVY